MLTIRKSNERGHVKTDWLETYHTFSFDTYHDPEHIHFRNLRVINEDKIAAGQGFGMHPHRDMEIITYIISGQLEHKDNMGNSSIINQGDIQRMSAGNGIMHSEYNPSYKNEVHLLQIWIFPDIKNIEPEYEQKHFNPEQKENRLCLIASPDRDSGAMTIHQDVLVYASVLKKCNSIKQQSDKNRHIWIQLISGNLQVNSQVINSGDGVSISGETEINFSANTDSEFLVFNMA